MGPPGRVGSMLTCGYMSKIGGPVQECISHSPDLTKASGTEKGATSDRNVIAPANQQRSYECKGFVNTQEDQSYRRPREIMTGSHSARDAVHRAIRWCRKGGGVQKYLAPVLALETMGNYGATGTWIVALPSRGEGIFW